MFDIWRKIAEKGVVAVPTKPEALTPLGWVEIAEKWPELVPEKYRHWNVYDDPQLISESPFVYEDGKGYLFVAKDERLRKTLKVSVDFDELIDRFGTEDYWSDFEVSFFMGILTCSCGDPGCAGIKSQTCHVSDRMVHWSVICNRSALDFFFERESYEMGTMRMLKRIVEVPSLYNPPGCSRYEGDHAAFVDKVYGMLDRKPYFRDMWDELEAEKNERGL